MFVKIHILPRVSTSNQQTGQMCTDRKMTSAWTYLMQRGKPVIVNWLYLMEFCEYLITHYRRKHVIIP